MQIISPQNVLTYPCEVSGSEINILKIRWVIDARGVFISNSLQ